MGKNNLFHKIVAALIFIIIASVVFYFNSKHYESNAFGIASAVSLAGDRISEVAHNIWGGLKSSVSSMARISGIPVSSLFFSPRNDNNTVVSLRDETKSSWERTQKEAIDNSRETEKLKKTIKKLERELETARQTTRIPREVVNYRTTETNNRVEINSASIEELTRIIHIGPARAEEIIRLRPFSSLDDLARVPGISEKIITAIKKQGLAYVEFFKIEERKTVEKKEVEKDTDPPATNPCLSGRVDINSAPLADLVFLKGIGESIGQRIIDHRRSSPLRSLDELELVRGIGPSVLGGIKEQGCAYVKNELSAALPTKKPEEVNKTKIETTETNNRVEINSASVEELIRIIHIGPARAEEIIRLRPFSSLDDLERVPGIGAKTIIAIKKQGLAYVEFSDIENNSKNSSHAEINTPITALSVLGVAQGVIITEVKINQREFVEIHNPTKEEIKMDEWRLSYYSNKREWNNPSINWKFPKDSVLRPNSYFLIGVYGYPKENGNPSSDWELLTAAGLPYRSSELANSNGSLAIFRCDPKGKELEKIKECLVDAVGWGNTLVRRGSASIAPEKDRSIIRKKNSEGKYINNEDNSNDFSVETPLPINSTGKQAI